MEKDSDLIKAIFDLANIGVCVVGTDGRFLKVNKEMSRIFGYSCRQIEKMDINSFTHPDDQAIGTEFLRKALAGKVQRINFEKRYIHKDGHIVYGYVSSTLVRDKKGKPLYFISYVQDITRQKQAEKKLELAAQEWQKTFDSSNDAICLLDSKQRILRANNAMHRIASGSIIGKKCWEVVHGTSKPIDGCPIPRMWKSKSREKMELQKDGITYEVTVDPILNDKKKIVGAVHIIRDITEKKLMQAMIEESEEKYRLLFSSAREAIFVADVDSGILVDCNEVACNLVERSRDELIGKHQSILHPVEDLINGHSLTYLQHVSGKNGEVLYDRIITKSGKIKDVEIKGRIITVRGRKLLHGLFIDVTERKKAEQALRDSEERFKRLVESTTDYIYSVKVENGKPVSTYHGPACATVTGYTSEDYRNDPNLWYRMVYDEDKPLVVKMVSDIVSGVEVHPLEHRIVHKNGSIRWVRNTPVPQYDKNGNLIAYDGLISDITDRKLAEQKLAESEALYRELFELESDAIFLVDNTTGNIIEANSAAVSLYGYTHDELVKLKITDLSTEPEDYRKTIQNAPKDSNKVVQLPIAHHRKKNGERFPVEITARFFTLKGKTVHIEAIRDITERTRLQEELLQSQKMQSIGTLAGGIAHDFNNILGIILGHTKLIEDRQIDENVFRKSISAIQQSVQRGASLVKQILTYARKTETTFELIDLQTLLGELVAMLKQTFPKMITFAESYETDLPKIPGDKTQLNQAFLNLCVNARDAMPKGGTISIRANKIPLEQMRASFSKADKDLYVCVSVTDTGEGMDESILQRIFDPFFTTKPFGQGIGMGLPVVFGIVQAHGGFLDVESKIGEGSTFKLFFPAAEIQIEQTKIHTDAEIVPDLSGKETVLIVEDEEFLIDILKHMFETNGYKIYIARNGLDAIEIYRQHQNQIDIVFTDLGLPGICGLEELRRLKEINPSVKVIFASGLIEPNIKSELLKAGAKGFVQKPYEITSVLRTVRDVLDKR